MGQKTGIEPSRFHYYRILVIYRLFYRVVRRLFSPYIRVRVRGREQVPRSGPILVLANHVGFLDPFVLPIALGRPVQFLATPTVFRKPILSLVANFFGVIPKKKFAPDVAAIFKLLEWAQLGSAVGLFPEGQRTWDSRTLGVVPGIGKLVRMLRAPVVTARIYNADRISPRWAIRQRKGHVIVDLDPPHQFERSTKPEEIEAFVAERITVDPESCPRAAVYGRDLARGIRNVLFLCPGCFAEESIEEHGNRIECTACHRRWIVGHDNTLTLEQSRLKYSLLSALDRIRDYLDSRDWIADEERYQREGIALESDNVRLFDLTGNHRKLLGRGRLQLTRDGVRWNGGHRIWSLTLKEILVATVDLTSDLQFRSEKGLFSAELSGESVVKWEWFVNHWLKKQMRRGPFAMG